MVAEYDNSINPLEMLQFLSEQENIWPFLEDLGLDGAKLQSECIEAFQNDEDSRQEWVEKHDEAMKLALQVADKKSYPFDNASNVIYPLITTGTVQFAARCYPNLVANREVVKPKVVGDDTGLYKVDPQSGQPVPVVLPGTKAERGTRVARYMNHQLLEVDQGWEEDTDRMLHYVPVAGCGFRKRWWDNGPKSKFVTAKNLVVNYSAQSLATATNISEIFPLEPYEITERVRSGLWDEEQVARFFTPETDKEARDFVEMHTRYDLDGDGYPEPYIVWFDRDTGTVVRVAGNFGNVEEDGQQVLSIRPRTYYIKYSFIPNPDGGFYDIGFGWLLGPINRAVNTSINQLNDGAHLLNAPSGFLGRGFRIKGGDTRLRPGEFKPVDAYGDQIKNNIHQLQFAGPSPVTLQLLQLMISSGQDISSVKDIMMGGGDSQIAPTTALTMVEQGSKQFSAIYKRLHRAMRDEARLLMAHNAEHAQEIGEDYMSVNDDGDGDPLELEANNDVVPVTDPAMVSEASSMAKAEALMQMAMNGVVDMEFARDRWLAAANIENAEEAKPKSQGPSPEQLIEMSKREAESRRIDILELETEAKALEMRTRAIKNLADAEAAEEGQNLAQYQAQVDATQRVLDEIRRDREMRQKEKELAQKAQAGGIPGMA